MNRWEKFKVWEILLLTFGIALLASAAAVFVSGISVRRYLLGWADEEGRAIRVALLSLKAGAVRRQISNESEFREIEVQSDLYNYDTIVTDAEGGASLSIDGGGVIEMGPTTMIRLAFETRFSLGGISRAASVQVVMGDVKGESKEGAAPIILKSRDKVVRVSKDRAQSIKVAAAPLVKATPKPIVTEAPPPVPVPVALAPPDEPEPSPTPEPSPSPSPSPSPAARMGFEMLTPREGEKLVVEKGSQVAQISVSFQWRVVPPGVVVQLALRRLPDAANKDAVEVVRKVVQPVGGLGTLPVMIKAPGTYEWSAFDEEGEPLKLAHASASVVRGTFSVRPDFEGVELLDVLVGGQAMRTNTYSGKGSEDFDITLRWKPYPDAEKHIVRVYDSPAAQKLVLSRMVDGDSYVFNKDKVFKGALHYRVEAPLESGFLAFSAMRSFNFNFLPPVLMIPTDRTTLSKAETGDDSILLTWQKTNFTDGYELEIAKDPDFTVKLVSRQVKENFYVWKGAPSGRLYWRVRSYAKEVKSAFSRPFSLTVRK